MAHYKKFTENATSFVCLACNHLQQETTVTQLKSEVESLRAELAKLTQLLLERDNPRHSFHSTAPTEVGGTRAQLNQLHLLSLELATSLLLLTPVQNVSSILLFYSIHECQNGTPTHQRLTGDMNSVSKAIQHLCHKYRHKLNKSSGVSIKPHMSYTERATEFCTERKTLSYLVRYRQEQH